ncbi:MAG: esterase-like activity of phytase family protein [Paracoccus sp. (in: a-proteobacteria)]|uniref:esterase-like activity of phytase family protein n=1 Tax=Paracoccus sp. TaxID=267 RepID=UPI0039E71B40
MKHRTPLRAGLVAAMALAAMLAHSCAAQTSSEADGAQLSAEYVGSYVWKLDEPDFGGYSGLEVQENGQKFTALSDRATLRWGRIQRDEQGAITGLETEGEARLHDSRGQPLKPGHQGDSEGLAIGQDGTIWISFEGLTRVAGYATPQSNAQVLPRPPAFRQMQRNSSLETLAILPDGTLLTVPERSGSPTTPFPVYRFRNHRWDQPFSIPRDGDWLAVDAEIGPDGRFYLLERDFLGLLGFRSRVRRFDISDTALSNPQVLLATRPLQYGNLEGLSVWDDGQGIRLSMISDDNFNMLLRTELVEYRLVKAPAP